MVHCTLGSFLNIPRDFQTVTNLLEDSDKARALPRWIMMSLQGEELQ